MLNLRNSVILVILVFFVLLFFVFFLCVYNSVIPYEETVDFNQLWHNENRTGLIMATSSNGDRFWIDLCTGFRCMYFYHSDVNFTGDGGGGVWVGEFICAKFYYAT